MNDFHGHDDVDLIAESAGFDSVLDAEVTALDVEGRFESSSLSLAHVLGGDESHQCDNRLGDSVHGEITGDIPYMLGESFNLCALKAHLLVLFSIEEVRAFKVGIKFFIS